MADWWQGGGESGGPSEADLRAAGFQYVGGGEGGSWQPPTGWVRDPSATMGYAPAPIIPPKVGWQPTTEALQQLTTVDPKTVSRFVETGEGGYTINEFFDPASQAKMLLAQPEKVTPEFIAQNYPGFERLPRSTLQAMANDWRNAYAQLMKINSPEKVPEGYAHAITRIEGGKPFISYGGETEMFQEAAPYVVYDPNYGLVVPQQGIRPEERKRSGLRGLLPSLALGAMFGPLAGALGGGIAGALGAGALTGGISASLNDGDILKGALTGGATAGLGQAVAPALDSVLNAADITGSAASAIKAGTIAAGKAALTGGDPLQSALTAAAGAGVGSEVAGLDVLKDLDPTVAKAITAAASGAARAAVSGGDPLQSALSGAINTTLGGLTAGTVAPTTPTVPPAQYAQSTGTMLDVPVVDVPEMTVDELIDEMLARQEPITELPSFDYATPTEQYIDAGGLAIPAQSGLYDATGRAITKDEYSTFTGPMFDEQGQMVVEAGEGLAAPRGEIEVAGTAPTYDDLLAQLMQQDEERAGMEAALLGYDQRLIEALEQQEAEKAALQKALENVGASQEAQRGQISGIQTGIGQLASGLINRLGITQQQLQQQITQAKQQAETSNLLALLGLLGQQQAPATPQPTPLAEIPQFYDITTGRYTSKFDTPYADGGTVKDLMNILKG